VPESTPTARGAFRAVGPTRIEEGWEISTAPGGAFSITDLSRLGKFSVRCAPAAAAAPKGFPAPWTTARVDDRLVTAAAAGEWLVITPFGEGPGVEEGGDVLSVVDISHGRAMLRLTGVDAVALLAHQTAVDLSPEAFPDGSSLRTYVDTIVTDIIRDDVEGTPSFILHSERSAGGSLLESLLDAGGGLGVRFAGDGGTSPYGVSMSRPRMP
jgi:heterotetrameric sarcosine oxidase gamma subunit